MSKVKIRLAPTTRHKRATVTHLSPNSREESLFLSDRILTLIWCLKTIIACAFTPRLEIWRRTMSLAGLTILRDRLSTTKTDTVLFFWSSLTSSKLNIRPCSCTSLEMAFARWSKSSTSTCIFGGAVQLFSLFLPFHFLLCFEIFCRGRVVYLMAIFHSGQGEGHFWE